MCGGSLRVFSLVLGLTWCEAETKTTFHQEVEIARRLNRICMQVREDHEDNKPRTTGGFSGTSSRGKGRYGRGHYARLVS